MGTENGYQLKRLLLISVTVTLCLAGWSFVLMGVNTPVSGATTVGTIKEESGKTRVYEGVNYLLDGNIEVRNSNSNVVFRNSSVVLSQDVGLDGVEGGGDDHIYRILVESGGTLEFYNSRLTTQTDQLHPYFALDIEVTGSGSKLIFDGSVLEGPGNLTVDDSGHLEVVDSMFVELQDKSELAYDIDGDASTNDDEDKNDDGIVLELMNDATGLITDSEIRDTQSFSGSGLDGLTAANITVAGGANLTVINSFLDIDLEDDSSTGSHNALKVQGGGMAYLVGVSINLTTSADDPALLVMDSLSRITYYRWLGVELKDGMSLKIGGEDLSLKMVDGTKYIDVGNGHLTDEMLDYVGRDDTTWSTTGDDGWAFIPVVTDIFTFSSMPNSLATPDYMVTLKLGTETANRSAEFPSYPKLPDDGDQKDIVSKVKWGQDFAEEMVSDLGGPLRFKNYVISPAGAPMFEELGVDMSLTSGTTYLTGSSAVIDGKVYTSYYAFDGHLAVSSGAMLVINDTTVRFLTDDGPAYILVENGGNLVLNNVSLACKGSNPLYIYTMGSSSTRFEMKEGTLDAAYMVVRNGADVEVLADNFTGSINVVDTGSSIDVTSKTVDVENLYGRDSHISLGGGKVWIGDIDWDDVHFSSTDSVFNLTLDLYGDADFLNATYDGTLPDGRSHWLKTIGSSTASLSWRVNAAVEDSVANRLPGASIRVERINGSVYDLVTVVETDGDAEASLELLQEVITSSGREFLGNYRMNATYNGVGSKGYSTKLGSNDRSLVISIAGGPNLVPKDIIPNGSLISGNHVKLVASISNDGIFDAGVFHVSMDADGQTLGEVEMGPLQSGGSGEAVFEWTCEDGPVQFNLVVDPHDEVSELGEDDNELHIPNTIGIGPDYTIQVSSNSTDWVYLESADIHLLVRNIGEEDPEGKEFYVNLTWTDGISNGPVASYVPFDYIPPGGSAEIWVPWAPTATGILVLTAQIVAVFDYVPINSADSLTVSVKTLPDLAVVPGSVEVLPVHPITVNSLSTLRFEVMNYGELDAPQFYVSVYHTEISDDNRLGPNILVDGLGPSGTTTLDFEWNVFLPVGEYELIIYVDSLNDTNEQMEDNNIIRTAVMIELEPDLTFVSELGFLPSPVTEGKNSTLWAVIENAGNTTALDVKVRIALDSDTNIIGEKTVDLDPGETYNYTIYWTSVGVGDHTVYASVDPENMIIEQDESNNLIFREILVLSKPDIGMGTNDLSFSPDSPIPLYSPVTLTAVVWNYGQTTAENVKVRFYDGNPTEGGRIINWGATEPSVVIEKIAGGDFEQVQITWNANTGGYHDIFVVMDPTDLIIEGNEENNRLSWRAYVLTLPELQVTSLEFYQGDVMIDSIGVGNEITINATVENFGDMPSMGFSVFVYNGDPIHDEDYFEIGSERRYPSAALQGRSEIHVEVPWIVTIPKGIREFYVHVVTTEGTEQREDNNWLSSNLEIFDIEDVPELSFDPDSLTMDTQYSAVGITGEEVLPQGLNITVLLNITNIGGKAASNTTVVFRAANETGRFNDVLTLDLGFIESGGNHTMQGYWKLETLGMNYLRIVVDPNNDLREFDEGNNLLDYEVEVIEAPDLTVSIVRSGDAWDAGSGQFKMEKGKEYSVSYTISNSGNYTFNGLDVTFDGPAIDSSQEVTIDPFGQMTVSFRVRPEVVYEGTVSWKCTVNSQGRFYESDTTNNEGSGSFVVKEKEEEKSLLIPILIVIVIIIIIAAVVAYFLIRRAKKGQMAKCSNCGGLVEIDADVCPHCGIEFTDEIECECGAVIPPEATECPECGRPVKIDTLKLLEEEEEEKEEEKEEVWKEEEEEMEVEEELEELEAEGVPELTEEKEIPKKASDLTEDISEEEMAECFECGAVIPISAPICPHCGAVFE